MDGDGWRRLVAVLLCGGGGYGGGLLLQAGRLDLAVCAWVAATLTSVAWIMGDFQRSS